MFNINILLAILGVSQAAIISLAGVNSSSPNDAVYDTPNDVVSTTFDSKFTDISVFEKTSPHEGGSAQESSQDVGIPTRTLTDDWETTTIAHVGCEVNFSSDGYTTRVPFIDCPQSSITSPPGWPPKPDEGCTTYQGSRYCAKGNCDHIHADYYGMDWWYTTCSTDGCNFITEGDSIGFDCATTRTLDSGCLEIKSKDWEAIFETTLCPVPTECTTTVCEYNSTTHTLTTCPPDAIQQMSYTTGTIVLGDVTVTTLYIPETTKQSNIPNPPISCEIATAVSDETTFTQAVCDHVPQECTTSTEIKSDNSTVTYLICETASIELFPPGVTTTTFCPHSYCSGNLCRICNRR
ncbi:hypothetical protein K4I79_004992 [Candida tropicalis]